MINTIEEVLGLLLAVAILALLSRNLPSPTLSCWFWAGWFWLWVPGLPRIVLNPELILSHLPAAVALSGGIIHSLA